MNVSIVTSERARRSYRGRLASMLESHSGLTVASSYKVQLIRQLMGLSVSTAPATGCPSVDKTRPGSTLPASKSKEIFLGSPEDRIAKRRKQGLYGPL